MYKTIILHVDGGPHQDSRLRAAALLAASHGAHLVGSAATGISMANFAILNSSMAMPISSEDYQALRDDVAGLLQPFEEQAARLGAPSVESRLVDDNTRYGLLLHSRYADLVVLSQDGRVARRLEEDGAKIEQEFLVEVRGATGPYTLGRLSRGLAYEGRALPPCKVSWQNEVRLRFAIKDVRPGQLRHMCAEVGLDVVAIRRLRIGRIGLNRMPPGEWRYSPVGDRF